MTGEHSAPYWRLSTFYLFYFASLGALMPYWGLYLDHLGFSVSDIGELIAVIMATKIIAPNVWGWIADHSGKRMRIVRITSLFSLVAYLGVYLGQSYLWMLLVMLVFSFFWNANLPQFEANTLAHLGRNTQRYSAIRLWGSIGFILAVVLLGTITEQYGAQWIPHVVGILLLGVWVFSLTTPERKAEHPEGHASGFREVISQPSVIALFVVCFLLQASHGPYYAFYTLYLEDHGFTRSTIGLLWALGVLAEIVIFMMMHWLLPRFGAVKLLVWALLFSALRWVIIGTSVDNHLLMTFAQLLHAASFGLYHAVAIHLVYGYFRGRLIGRGQALYSSLSFGAGGAVGTLYGGYVWESGGAVMAFGTSAVLCLIAAVIALKMIKPMEVRD